MQKTVDIETGKLSSNLTSSATMKIEQSERTQQTLKTISDNKDINVNTTIELEGEPIAKSTNKVNKKLDLQYSF